MKTERFIPSIKEFILIALLLCTINTLAVLQEDLMLVKWSRFCSTISLLVYLIYKYKIYTKKSFLIGFICIVLTDLCLIYFDYMIISILFVILSLGGFGFFLWNVTKLIDWKKITLSNVVVLVLLLCLKFYLVVYTLELVSDNVDPLLYIIYYIYAAISIVFTFLAGLAYLQTEKAGNEHFVIIPYAYLISNTFLGFAIYSSNYWGYYFSRFFYIITICVLAHFIVRRLYNDYIETLEVEGVEIKN
jgi:hypothetical protein